MADRSQDRIALVFGAGSCGLGCGNGAVDRVAAAAAETGAVIRGEGVTMGGGWRAGS